MLPVTQKFAAVSFICANFSCCHCLLHYCGINHGSLMTVNTLGPSGTLASLEVSNVSLCKGANVYQHCRWWRSLITHNLVVPQISPRMYTKLSSAKIQHLHESPVTHTAKIYAALSGSCLNMTKIAKFKNVEN
ncbi:hypothetical protein J6590_037129 [Homalodisca vitripennis]|nr:hypothetical protein J6590_037129 [Homalodisca vitripennis]